MTSYGTDRYFSHRTGVWLTGVDLDINEIIRRALQLIRTRDDQMLAGYATLAVPPFCTKGDSLAAPAGG